LSRRRFQSSRGLRIRDLDGALPTSFSFCGFTGRPSGGIFLLPDNVPANRWHHFDSGLTHPFANLAQPLKASVHI